MLPTACKMRSKSKTARDYMQVAGKRLINFLLMLVINQIYGVNRALFE